MSFGPAAAILTASLALAACSHGVSAPGFALPDPPPRVAGATPVRAGDDLQAAVDAAAPGTALWLEPGLHAGPVRIDKELTLQGPRDAVVASAGTGSTIEVAADDVVLAGFSIDGSGGRFDLLDAAVRVRGRSITIAGLSIERALFGILCERSSDLALRGNRVIGSGQGALGLRGDGIRLWETTDSAIEHNWVTDARDIVVWYSSRNRVAGNFVTGGRYGTHFMYSHECLVEGNRYDHNVVGVFVMYSRDVTLRDNVMLHSHGAAGIGLGVKESSSLAVIGNRFAGNTKAVYLDTSPLERTAWNLFERNEFAFGDVGVGFHAPPWSNRFADNSFRGNLVQVTVGGGGTAEQVDFEGNHFDDYRGYDLDGDGRGDVPYELRSLSGELKSRFPELAFLHGTPSLGMVDLAGHVIPLYRPSRVLADPSPRMRSALGGADAR